MAEIATNPSLPVEHLTKTQRAAVVLLALGEGHAVEVLRRLPPAEIQRLGAAMTSPAAKNVDFNTLSTIMEGFVQDLKSPSRTPPNVDDYVRAVMIDALGDERASSMMDRIELSHATTALEPLKQMEPRAVAEMIRGDHPQIMAIILSHIESEQAAAVLKLFKEDIRGDVMMRIATLDTIPPNALSEINDVMARKFSGAEQIKASTIGGVKVAANILNLMDSGQEENILNHIQAINSPLSAQIRELMFVFDNLLDLDDRAIQLIIREVSIERLGVALRASDERMLEKITRNMSQRQGEILREDMEARGPIRVTEVESAQKEVLAVVRQLGDEGQIQLVVKPEAYV